MSVGDATGVHCTSLLGCSCAGFLLGSSHDWFIAYSIGCDDGYDFSLTSDKLGIAPSANIGSELDDLISAIMLSPVREKVPPGLKAVSVGILLLPSTLGSKAVPKGAPITRTDAGSVCVMGMLPS
jgi:hypothetical protein